MRIARDSWSTCTQYGTGEVLTWCTTASGRSICAREPAGDLFGRPALARAIEGGLPEVVVSFELGALPAACPGLLVGVGGLVADPAARVASDLASNGRWRAIQICRDLPDRMALGPEGGNSAAVFE
jgi:hypothetical protein